MSKIKGRVTSCSILLLLKVNEFRKKKSSGKLLKNFGLNSTFSQRSFYSDKKIIYIKKKQQHLSTYKNKLKPEIN